MSIRYTNNKLLFINNNLGEVTASGLGPRSLDPNKVQVRLDQAFESFRFLFPSESAGTNNDITILYATQSNGDLHTGIGTINPLSTLDIKSTTTSSAATLTLRNNQGTTISSGVIPGKIQFLIESSSFALGDYETSISGSTAEIFSRVTDVDTSGVKGSLVFGLSKTSTTENIDALQLGYEIGPTTLGTGDVHAVLSGSIATQAVIPRIVMKRDGQSSDIVNLGSFQAGATQHGVLRLFEDNSGDIRIQFTTDPTSNSYISSSNFGIGTSAPGEKLTVTGNISASNNIYGKVYYTDGYEALSHSGNILIFSNTSTSNQYKGTNHNFGDAPITASIISASDELITNDLNVNNITLQGSITHDGDPDTLISFTPNDILFYAGNVEGLQLLPGIVTINGAGANQDFRVEGDTDGNLLYTDASTDKVGIGTNTPIEKLTVIGNISASSNINSFTYSVNNIQALAQTTQGVLDIGSNGISNLYRGTNHDFPSSITSSAEISASGDLYGYDVHAGNDFVLYDNVGVISETGGTINLGNNSYSTGYKGTSHTFGTIVYLNSITKATGAITASGGISASFLTAGTTDANGAAISTVMVDTATGRFYHTGSYGGGGGGGITEIAVGTGLDITDSTGPTATVNLDLTEVIATDASNRILTSDGDGTLTGEADLKYDGSTLTILGDVALSTGEFEFLPQLGSTQPNGIYIDGSNTGTIPGFTADGNVGYSEHLEVPNTATLTLYDIVYLRSNTGAWAAARADAESTSKNLLGMVLKGGTYSRAMTKGYVRVPASRIAGADLSSPSPNYGDPLYISTGSAGYFQHSPPTTSTHVIRCVGHVVNYTLDRSSNVTSWVIKFDPSQDFTTL